MTLEIVLNLWSSDILNKYTVSINDTHHLKYKYNLYKAYKNKPYKKIYVISLTIIKMLLISILLILCCQGPAQT